MHSEIYRIANYTFDEQSSAAMIGFSAMKKWVIQYSKHNYF